MTKPSFRMHSGKGTSLGQFGPMFLFIVSLGSVGLLCVTLHSSSLVMPAEPRVAEDLLGLPADSRLKSTRKLIAAIRKAALAAAGGVNEPAALTSHERRIWDVANPCRSRSELKAMYKRRMFAPDVDENLHWDLVLSEYSKLHRTCRQRVGNLREYFLTKNSSISGCKFAIADFSEDGGLGNKILAITNTVLYSVLTQRVVLVPSASLVPALMCEPFPGSSWLLEAGHGDTFPVPPWLDEHVEHWTFHKDVFQELDDARPPGSNSGSGSGLRSGNDSQVPQSQLYASAMVYQQYQPASRFYCDAEQTSFSGVTWLYFTGCLYIIPRFFTVPSMRLTLEVLFPDRLVLTHMVRSLMLPDDVVWERILRNDAAHMRAADRRVGVQIRYRRNVVHYQQMNQVINQRFMECAVENGVLPMVVDYNGTSTDPESSSELVLDRAASKSSAAPRPPPVVVKIFVASLFTGFSDMMSETYLPRPTSTGEVVGVVQLSHAGLQTYGLEVDRQSLLEIFMLSFSDDLFVTPLSTFGGLAQAYGVLVPWILDFREGTQFGSCERGQTIDLCYQEADFTYTCPHDLDVDQRVISEVVPYVENCLPVDTQLNIPPGFQLITAPNSKTNSSRGA